MIHSVLNSVQAPQIKLEKIEQSLRQKLSPPNKKCVLQFRRLLPPMAVRTVLHVALEFLGARHKICVAVDRFFGFPFLVGSQALVSKNNLHTGV